ncbi:MAG: phage terminase large subunit family protein [Armatimonadota bacterium]
MTRKKSKRQEKSGLEEIVDVSSVASQTFALVRKCSQVLKPPPKQTVSEWADENRKLPESSAYPGQWRTSRVPHLREPMDACSDPEIEKIVLMFAAQTAKSEGMNNIAGYFIDNDPAPIMFIQPTIKLAEAYSKERLQPMISDTPCLAAKVSEQKSRDGSNTIERKEYPGGHLVMIGANAPGDLAGRFIRILLCDEIDRYPVSTGTEGDPISLAEKRQTTFFNALTVVSSTPTVKGESRIEAEYEQSSREVWTIPCPSCGEMQQYEWSRLNFETACMICEKCGAMHSEFEWKAGTGKWIARAENRKVRGFYLHGMASPWLRWTAMIKEFKEALAKGPEVLKTFVNTRWAETWEEKGESVDEDLLKERRHYYNCDVPAEVLLLTSGVDVHPDRLELEVVGWGYGAESWGVQYAVLPGDPNKTAVWDDLDEFLQGTYKRADGAILPISCTCIDAQYATSSVYSFCRTRMNRYIFAIRGVGGPGIPEVGPYRKQGKNKDVPQFPVGTDSSKDMFMSRLMVESEGGGYCHWPREEHLQDGSLRGYGPDYFKGLMTEKRVERKSHGRIHHIWVKKSSHARNEALDCRVYASAALRVINPKWDQISNRSKVKQTSEQSVKKTGRRRIHSRGVAV